MCSPPEKRTEGILTTVSGTFVAARQQEGIDRKMQLCYKNRVVKKTDTGDWSNGMIGVSKTFGGSSILSAPVKKDGLKPSFFMPIKRKKSYKFALFTIEFSLLILYILITRFY